MAALRSCLLTSALVTCALMVLMSQTEQSISSLEIEGRAGRAKVIQRDGRSYVDLRSLVEMTGASVSLSRPLKN